MSSIARRTVLGGAAALVGAASALGHRARAQVAKPASPLSITIVDVAGNLALTQKAFENYRKAKPEMVSRIVFTKAPAPELPGKIKAQQDAGRVDIDMVLTGTDALAAGIAQNIWEPLFPAHAESLPDLKAIYLPGAALMQGLANGQGVVNAFCPAGPLLEYMPNRVSNPPDSAESLLAWCKAHKDRFMYARPANSGAGRAFLMGLPYILGDSNPKDPKAGWDKTWSFLKELDQTIEYYPSGTAAVFKELGDGSRDLVTTITGWDINPRALGIVPKEAKVTSMKGFHFVTDAHYMCLPKNLTKERTAVLLDMMNFILTKPQQAITYDEGYFYPGPAVAGVTLDMAPADSQSVLKEFGRPEYDKLIADTPKEVPLDADTMVYAFRRWDEQIGSRKTK
jgi:putative spermidine/putrescine transport system substrate-binding protein